MAISPSIVFFGKNPSTIILQSSTNFDGTAQGSDPAITPGLYTFPAQAGGGLYNFHDLVGTQEAISIQSISYLGGGTLTVKRKLQSAVGTPTVTIGTVTTQGDLVFEDNSLVLPFHEDLVFTSSGGTSPVIAVTAKLANGGQGL
jgi:hypothetical protein